MLIDDIGFGAVSSFGGGIHTPTFDRLADGGLRFNHFHTTALCSPTRAALLSGRNHHQVNVGCVMEIATGFPGNQGERPPEPSTSPRRCATTATARRRSASGTRRRPGRSRSPGPTIRWPTNSGFDKFYGFIGGETNQWDPVIFDGVTKVAKKDDPDYHFTTDMTNEAINWVKFQQAMTPDKPFFIYFAPGAVHAPHHAPKSFIEKYKGKFDAGWQKYREETFARQKAMGIIPRTPSSPRCPTTSRTGRSSATTRRRSTPCRWRPSPASPSTPTSRSAGWWTPSTSLGVLDNTLFIYIMGDNGSSGEGGLTGTYNELVHLNGIFDAETDREHAGARG